jgi:outer membrane lipoprotein SlyB
MKKFLATLLATAVLSLAALPAAAQTRTRCANRTYGSQSNRQYDPRYDQTVYRNDGYQTDPNNTADNIYYGRNRSVWDKHRDKITTAGGAVGGAILGGLIGGRKGAVIGAITGGAGAAVYTYKIRDKYPRY